MASQSKSQLIGQICNLLKKRYKTESADSRLTILEAVVLGICRENSTAEQANQVLSRIKEHFFDWNEVRVSTIQEIEGVLAGLSHTEQRATAIRSFLRQLYIKTYAFSLDALLKKPLKDSIKALQAFDVLKSDYILATVVHRALGGHAIPVDSGAQLALTRLGVSDAKTDTPTLRASLERVIPKSQGAQFQDWMESLCVDVCWAVDPRCPECELRKLCPYGQERIAALKSGAKPSKASPAPEPAHAAAGATGKASKAPAARKAEPPSKQPATPRKKAVPAPAPDAKKPAKPASEKPAKPASEKPTKPASEKPAKPAPTASSKPTKPAPTARKPPAPAAKKTPAPKNKKPRTR